MLPEVEYETTDNLEDLLAVLPPRIAAQIGTVVADHQRGAIVEIVMDLGRLPEVRFASSEQQIGALDVTRDDLLHVAERIGSFGDDNRAGIERTLHRISAIRNRSGEIVGLTCRVGRAVYGTISIIRDLIESGESILLVGRPGVGKTTLLRETARVLADDLSKRVIVVDTSNEIAGDGDIPHPAIGRARRMQVPTPTAQHAVMIEAVENHMPQVIVIDEIGTELEAMAARTIAERGVQLIGTAHGNSLENLMLNPTLSDLIGGIQSVTLSDEEARRRGTQKSILERKAPPTFGMMVELLGRDEVAVHKEVAATVDALLRGAPVRPEIRHRSQDGTISFSEADEARRDPMSPILRAQQQLTRRSSSNEWDLASRASGTNGADAHDPPQGGTEAPDAAYGPIVNYPGLRGRGAPGKPLRVYPFGVSRNRLEQAMRSLGLNGAIVRDARDADMVMTLKNYYRTKPQPVRDAELRGTPVYVLRSNTIAQMQNALSPLLPEPVETEDDRSTSPVVQPVQPIHSRSRESGTGAVTAALEEAEDAIGAVMRGMPSIALTPQTKHVRRMQHELADRYNVSSRSRGKEPHRRVEIFRGSIY
ncbi:MAG: AAA family ATPase [Thermomicrobiales bacterium]|nr:AAA family ATPase [Thermomicrobiales bacterium]